MLARFEFFKMFSNGRKKVEEQEEKCTVNLPWSLFWLELMFVKIFKIICRVVETLLVQNDLTRTREGDQQLFKYINVPSTLCTNVIIN